MGIHRDPEPLTLATWPTPVEPAPRLAQAVGLGIDDLWVKRDDLVGLGGGGNKVRKLQRTCAVAVAAGARTLVTTGAAQSNHARLTAAAGARLGLDVELVLAGTAPAPNADPTGNLLLDRLFGARLIWAGDVAHEDLERLAAARVAELALGGTPAAQIPYGGSSAAGAMAYVEAGQELLEQVPDVAHVVVAVGSAGTAAGLVTALGAERVLGVDTGATSNPHERIASLVTELGGDPTALRLRTDQIGAGYSTLTDAVGVALVLAARTEGLVLDPIYTGRALAGLVAAVRDGEVGPGQRTVLLHTGGLPGLFGSDEAVRFIRSLA
jgi:1-aminocyclopropane-1-carboxylate deaminase/D-cysteine desulfhydrase-like pyridoxal-dependent ACC family enzyme